MFVRVEKKKKPTVYNTSLGPVGTQTSNQVPYNFTKKLEKFKHCMAGFLQCLE
jgi:hypothetical protein